MTAAAAETIEINAELAAEHGLSGDEYALKCDQYDQAVAKNIVVERTQELGDEKWCEAALSQ